MAKHSFALKMDRALEHATTLDGLCRAYLERHPDPFEERWRQDGDELVLEYFFRERLTADPTWSLLIGDSLHNLRSVLDHLVLDLGVAYNNGPLSEKVIKQSAFPIAGRSPLSTADANVRIGHVHPDARVIIEGLQPNLSADYTKEPLWILQELDNIDKHRLLHAAAVGAPGAGINELAGFRSYKFRGGTAEEPGPVLTIRFDPTEEKKYSGQLHRVIAFADGPAKDGPIVQTLMELIDYVRLQVVAPLSRFL